MTDEVNLNDEELNLPDHRFTQQAKDLANLQNNASIISTDQTENTDITVNLELFQEKQDEIERLQDMLQKKEEELVETHKFVADLTENLKIAEARTENAIAEREKLADKNREYIHKIQTLKDQTGDQVIQIDEYESKIQLIKGENQMLRDS